MTRRRATFALVLLAIVGGCSPIAKRPDITHYQLVAEPTPLNLPPGISVEVGEVTGNRLFFENGVVFKTSPYELDAYYYSRWVDPPTELVRERLKELVAAPPNLNPRPPAVKVLSLSATIDAFQQVDQSDHSSGLVEIRFCLSPTAAPKQPLWCTVAKHDTVAADKTPAAAVAAINTSFNQVLADLASSLHATTPLAAAIAEAPGTQANR